MSLRYFRSISPGTRHTILDSFSEITTEKPEKRLLKSNQRVQGRNHRGVITCRHRGGGHKRLYRKIDVWRKKLDSVGYICTIEYDPNRNALIALVHYEDGEKTYILVPKGFQVGQVVMIGFRVPIENGNTLPLWNIPLGINVYNVEFRPSSGRKLARSSGTSAQLIAREYGFATLRLPSGEVRLVPQTCWATVGQVYGSEVGNKKIGKAGRIRWLGWRPTVRGTVINPVDHPHGGGEGCCPIGRSRPSTPWGKPRLGVKTRYKKKYSNVFIIRRLFYYLFFMVRSVKKGPYVAHHLLVKVERINELSEKNVVETWSRSSIIVPIIIGHTISVYNGHEHLSVFITDQIVGHKLGEFSSTRTFRGHVKLDKKTRRLYLNFLFFMGQKVHPVGIRLGITKKSCSHWYASSRSYAFFLAEDKRIRDYVFQFCCQCIVSSIEVERRKVGVRFRISIAQVELFVGSEGKVLAILRQRLQQRCSSFRSDYIQYFSFSKFNLEITGQPEVQIFIRQLRSPEADSQCLGDFIVFELEKRVPFRRVLRMAKERAQALGRVLGLRLQIAGRLNGAEIARTEWVRKGCVPLHTFSVDLDYANKVARTFYGLLGIKIWIFHSIFSN